MFIVKVIENNTVQSVQEYLHLFSYLFSCSPKVIFVILTSSIFSLYSSTNLSTNFFLHVQFYQPKYFPTLHDLLHSHSQLLVFQMNPLSQLTFSINSLHSHLHLSSFQRCLLLQKLASNLHLHYKVHAIVYILLHLSLILD